jgi:hypothetical protein
MDGSTADYVIVFVVGGFLGLCELLSRYRDEPFRAVLNLPAIAYIMINAGAALLALLLINVWQPDFGLDPAKEAEKLRVIRILVAGLGAMAFFRSSIFNFRIGETDVPLGPSLIMQVLLDVTDRAVDRGRAAPRGAVVSEVMVDIDFEKASLALPAYCFALMQNVTKEEQSAIGQQVQALNTPNISPPIRSYLLGLVLLNIVGETVLREAIKHLRPHITVPPPPPPIP